MTSGRLAIFCDASVLDRHRRLDAELPEPSRAVRDDDRIEYHHPEQAHNTASIHPLVARPFDRVEQSRADSSRVDTSSV